MIYAGGTIGISGVVGGDVTLYTPNTLVILDDVRYANDPAKGLCIDILGTISGQNTYVADNSINTPQVINTGSPTVYRSLDDTPDLNLDAVIMALGTSFTVENYNSGPTNALTCGTSTDGHGCLYLTGGLIQNNRGPVGLTSGRRLRQAIQLRPVRGGQSAPVFPDDGPVPRQSLLRARSGAREVVDDRRAVQEPHAGRSVSEGLCLALGVRLPVRV